MYVIPASVLLTGGDSLKARSEVGRVSSLMRLGVERYVSADATLLLCIFMDQPGK